MKGFNKTISTVVLICFLFNTAVQDLAFGQSLYFIKSSDKLAPPSRFSKIAGTEGADMATIKLALTGELMSFASKGELATMAGSELAALIERASRYKKTIFSPPDLQFFLQEIEDIGDNRYCVQCRVTGKKNPRVYYAVFELPPPDGELNVEVYKEKEFTDFKNDGKFHYTNKKLPQRKDAIPEDAEAIRRRIEEGEVIDEFIAGKYRNNEVLEFSGRSAAMRKTYPDMKALPKENYLPDEALKPLITRIDRFLGLFQTSFKKAFGDRNVVLVGVNEDNGETSPARARYFRVVTNDSRILVSGHLSDASLYLFITKNEFRQIKESRTRGDSQEAIGEFIASCVEDSTVHEAGVSHDISWSYRVPYIASNSLDSAFVLYDRSVNDTKLREVFERYMKPQFNAEDLAKLTGEPVVLSANSRRRDYAASPDIIARAAAAIAPNTQYGRKKYFVDKMHVYSTSGLLYLIELYRKPGLLAEVKNKAKTKDGKPNSFTTQYGFYRDAINHIKDILGQLSLKVRLKKGLPDLDDVGGIGALVQACREVQGVRVAGTTSEPGYDTRQDHPVAETEAELSDLAPHPLVNVMLAMILQYYNTAKGAADLKDFIVYDKGKKVYWFGREAGGALWWKKKASDETFKDIFMELARINAGKYGRKDALMEDEKAVFDEMVKRCRGNSYGLTYKNIKRYLGLQIEHFGVEKGTVYAMKKYRTAYTEPVLLEHVRIERGIHQAIISGNFSGDIAAYRLWRQTPSRLEHIPYMAVIDGPAQKRIRLQDAPQDLTYNQFAALAHKFAKSRAPVAMGHVKEGSLRAGYSDYPVADTRAPGTSDTPGPTVYLRDKAALDRLIDVARSLKSNEERVLDAVDKFVASGLEVTNYHITRKADNITAVYVVFNLGNDVHYPVAFKLSSNLHEWWLITPESENEIRKDETSPASLTHVRSLFVPVDIITMKVPKHFVLQASHRRESVDRIPPVVQAPAKRESKLWRWLGGENSTADPELNASADNPVAGMGSKTRLSDLAPHPLVNALIAIALEKAKTSFAWNEGIKRFIKYDAASNIYWFGDGKDNSSFLDIFTALAKAKGAVVGRAVIRPEDERAVFDEIVSRSGGDSFNLNVESLKVRLSRQVGHIGVEKGAIYAMGKYDTAGKDSPVIKHELIELGIHRYIIKTVFDGKIQQYRDWRNRPFLQKEIDEIVTVDGKTFILQPSRKRMAYNEFLQLAHDVAQRAFRIEEGQVRAEDGLRMHGDYPVGAAAGDVGENMPTFMQITTDIGRQITPPEVKYKVIVPDSFFGSGELKNFRREYDRKFDIDTFQTITPRQRSVGDMVTELLQKAGPDANKTVALIPKDWTLDTTRQIDRLTSAGIRLMVADTNSIIVGRNDRYGRDEEKIKSRQTFQRDTLGMLLLIRGMDGGDSEAGFRFLLGRYIKQYVELTCGVTVDQFIDALKQGDIVSIVKCWLVYRPISAADARKDNDEITYTLFFA